jgi:hypothetical protein
MKFQQRIQESRELNFYSFAATAETRKLTRFLSHPVGSNGLVPHQAYGHPLSSSCNAHCPWPTVELVPVVAKIRLSGSEVG